MIKIYLLLLLSMLLTACGGGSGGTSSNTPVACTDTSWTPAADTISSGVSFQQDSNCNNTRDNIGILSSDPTPNPPEPATTTKSATTTTPATSTTEPEPEPEPVSVISFDASQSLYLNLLKTQINPTHTSFTLKTMPSKGTITIGQSTLTYLSHQYKVTDTFSVDTTGNGIADVEVKVRIVNGDPIFKQQWYIVNQRSDILGDINAQKTLAQGFSGKGVKVAVVEISSSGIANINHEDLNIALADTFANGKGAAEHATAVAGIIAGKGYNGLGIRGIAYGARVLSYYGDTSTANNWASAVGSSTLSPNSAQADVFNASVQFANIPNAYTYRRALKHGTKYLRAGKGANYVVSAGNDGLDANGKVIVSQVELHGNIWQNYPIIIGGLDPFTNKKIGYASVGNGLWLTTYSKPDANNDNFVYATAPTNGLASTGINSNSAYLGFGGTSGSTPIVAGAIALMLEANAALTWRDVRYILAKTSTKVDATSAVATTTIAGEEIETRLGWVTNAAGFDFHIWYGFGSLNVDAAVALATNYTTNTYSVLNNSNYVDLSVHDATDDKYNDPYLVQWHASQTLSSSVLITLGATGVSKTLTVTQDISIESLEYFFDIDGNSPSVLFKLTSPAGTSAILKTYLGRDHIRDRFKAFANNFFGESSQGDWVISLHDVNPNAYNPNPYNSLGFRNYLKSWGLRFNGVMN